ncbi:MAG: YfiR family protein [Verrucomicrobia bacterium]|nr:YfiR family protein [Verrucomicrobiota bacterium]
MKAARLILVLLAWAGILGHVVSAAGAAPQVTEQEVKAEFLRRIAFYTEWPANRFPKEDSPVVIGVVGRSGVAAEVEKLAKKKGTEIKRRRIEARRLNVNDDLSQCHVLFIGAETDYEPLLAKLKNTSVLTVGEHRAFARNGGMVNFVLQEESVKFEVNIAVATQAGLRLSSELLDVVRGWKLIVDATPQKRQL